MVWGITNRQPSSSASNVCKYSRASESLTRLSYTSTIPWITINPSKSYSGTSRNSRCSFWHISNTAKNWPTQISSCTPSSISTRRAACTLRPLSIVTRRNSPIARRAAHDCGVRKTHRVWRRTNSWPRRIWRHLQHEGSFWWRQIPGQENFTLRWACGGGLGKGQIPRGPSIPTGNGRTTDFGATATTNGILYARSGITHARSRHDARTTTKNSTIPPTTSTVDGTANTAGLPTKQTATKKVSDSNYCGNHQQQSWGQIPNTQYQHPAVN